jgi:lipoate-protein ligase B
VENLISPGDIPVFEVERGGDVTYHGPGQLVGYPIVLLEGVDRDLHRFLRNLEEALIRASRALGIESGRAEGKTGTWVEGARKLASIGIAVKRWVTYHGFALNVSTDLKKFGSINPCGFAAGVMTSLSAEAGRAISLAEVTPLVVGELAAVFEAEVTRTL